MREDEKEIVSIFSSISSMQQQVQAEAERAMSSKPSCELRACCPTIPQKKSQPTAQHNNIYFSEEIVKNQFPIQPTSNLFALRSARLTSSRRFNFTGSQSVADCWDRRICKSFSVLFALLKLKIHCSNYRIDRVHIEWNSQKTESFSPTVECSTNKKLHGEFIEIADNSLKIVWGGKLPKKRGKIVWKRRKVCSQRKNEREKFVWRRKNILEIILNCCSWWAEKKECESRRDRKVKEEKWTSLKLLACYCCWLLLLVSFAVFFAASWVVLSFFTCFEPPPFLSFWTTTLDFLFRTR